MPKKCFLEIINNMNITIPEIFDSLPHRFKAEKAENYQANFHFIFSKNGQSEYEYSVLIQNQQCIVKKGLEPQPSCVVKSSSENYIAVELGQKNAQTAIMSGEIQIDNLMEMLNFSKLFKKLEITPNTQSIDFQDFKSRKPQTGPLLGLKILDLTRLLPGPLATMLLADMGAEVIKIEAPKFYDYTRDFPPHIGGESIGYLAFNRSKRNLCLDYQSPEGKEILLNLVREADIVMEQFRPGVMAKMGLGYEDLKKINPKIIYVSITGYGQTGPYANLAGHDLNYITLAGLLSGNQFSAPQVPLPQIADIAGGSYMAVIGCLSAVYARQKTGVGQFVDISMMDGVMPLAVNAQAGYLLANQLVPRDSMFLSGGLVNYGIYPCKNNRYVALGTLEAKFWERFCEIIQKPEWKGRIVYKTQSQLNQYKQELAEVFLQEEAEYWADLGLKHDLLLNVVYELDEVEKDPHVQAREMIVELEHPTAGKIKTLGVPIKFSETKATASWAPALLGEDSIAIMREAGVSETTIKELISKGILKTA
jgi:crotonobetainyl-CoA:carnitine CoA-transferase CaiB-like acyl-CoA transferase/putative sterol carrier protein